MFINEMKHDNSLGIKDYLKIENMFRVTKNHQLSFFKQSFLKLHFNPVSYFLSVQVNYPRSLS